MIEICHHIASSCAGTPSYNHQIKCHIKYINPHITHFLTDKTLHVRKMMYNNKGYSFTFTALMLIAEKTKIILLRVVWFKLNINIFNKNIVEQIMKLFRN